MAIGEIRQGQILPLIFEIRDQKDEIVNLFGATSKIITIKKSNGEEFTVDAEFVTNGTDGLIQHITRNEGDTVDLSVVSTDEEDYQAQGWVIVGGIEYPSDIAKFPVYPNLKRPT